MCVKYYDILILTRAHTISANDYSIQELMRGRTFVAKKIGKDQYAKGFLVLLMLIIVLITLSVLTSKPVL